MKKWRVVTGGQSMAKNLINYSPLDKLIIIWWAGKQAAMKFVTIPTMLHGDVRTLL